MLVLNPVKENVGFTLLLATANAVVEDSEVATNPCR